MNGRKPKPLAADGEKKRHRANAELIERERSEPVGAPDALVPPKELSEEARKEWRRVVRLYRQLNYSIANDLDRGVLAAYCESWAILQKAMVEYQTQPLVVLTKDRLDTNPYVKIIDREGANIAKFSELLCLSPVGRARMGTAKANREKSDDPMAKLLAAGPPGRGVRM